MEQTERREPELASLWSELGRTTDANKREAIRKTLGKHLADLLMVQKLTGNDLYPLFKEDEEKRKRLVKSFLDGESALPDTPDEFRAKPFEREQFLASFSSHVNRWSAHWKEVRTFLIDEDFAECEEVERLGNKSETRERLVASFYYLRVFLATCMQGPDYAALDRDKLRALYREFLAQDATLNVLTRKREELSEAEWGLLWGLVYEILRRSSFPQYSTLLCRGWWTRKEDLIAVFFADRFVRGVRSLPCDIDRGFLVTAYSRFLWDQIRQLPAGAEIPPNQGAGPATASMLLANYGLSEEEVKMRAYAFLNAEPPWQELKVKDDLWWIHCMLADHHCADQNERKPLSRVAVECDIPAYHARAKRLGITGGYASPADYGQTYLGRWIISVLGQVDQTDRDAVKVVREIFCIEALKYKGRRRTQPRTRAR
jgi:hypothetical protein